MNKKRENNYAQKRNAPGRNSKKKKTSSINPSLLVKNAINIEEKVFMAEQKFSEMNLSQKLKNNIRKKGYILPTEIQQNAIGELIKGQNLIGIANTGTGKTGAFLIPTIERMLKDKTTKCLVVLPTRELAMQVDGEFKSLTTGMNLFSSCFIGGTSVNNDIRKAKKNNHLIVGTPGRLNDLSQRGALRLNNISILILDEFDRMLDMGFIDDIKKLVSQMDNRKQTMLFSATYNKSQKDIISKIVKNPVRINVSNGLESVDTVEQDIIRVKSNEDKFDILYKLLKSDGFDKVLLFAETKRSVDKISKKLCKSGIKSDVLHGNKSQNYRSNAIRLFKAGKTKVLVATDVASRGIDIDNVTHVVNYQLPLTMDSYIHRIGRTGRAGKKGMAYTFVN